MRRRVYAQRPEGRTYRARELRALVTNGALAQAIATRQVKELRRDLRRKHPWMRPGWTHDPLRAAEAIDKRARRRNK